MAHQPVNPAELEQQPSTLLENTSVTVLIGQLDDEHIRAFVLGLGADTHFEGIEFDATTTTPSRDLLTDLEPKINQHRMDPNPEADALRRYIGDWIQFVQFGESQPEVSQEAREHVAEHIAGVVASLEVQLERELPELRQLASSAS